MNRDAEGRTSESEDEISAEVEVDARAVCDTGNV